MLKNLKSTIKVSFLILLVFFSFFVVYRQYSLEKAREARAKAYAVSSWNGDYMLLARLISGEAKGEPYIGQVGVGAVILNRTKNPKFPPTIASVIFQPGAFESVSNGSIWYSHPTRENLRAAQDALSGWDPTYGSLFFWNPYKKVNPWIWRRPVVTQIGRHVFGK